MLKIVRAVILAGAIAAPAAAHAAGGDIEIPRQSWSFNGITGMYDEAQLQRGFQVYKEVCAACHGMKRIAFRNLYERGGPEFPEEAVKALAATYEVTDGPNDDGKMFQRPAKASDRWPSPYANEKEARSIHNGAYPPDLSIIAKARGVANVSPWWKHVFWDMPRDVVTGYQAGGADYVYALLTGYVDPPAGFQLADGMSYNKYFSGNQIAMANPFAGGDGQVTYAKGPDGKPTAPETVEQYAKDVSAFLMWAADPNLEQRKQMGWTVLLYLLVTSILLYIAKKRIWAAAH
jgi:ubiquinol-cytochrome c reductase cytochrome c1 subunit